MWLMIWEQDIEVIVMLTSLQEGTRKKCEPYWPQAPGDQLVFAPRFAVTSKEATGNDPYDPVFVTTRLELKDIASGEVRTVWHVQYKSWPDHGVPKEFEPMVAFLKEVNRLRRRTSDKATQTLVHCSAGVGRCAAAQHTVALFPFKRSSHTRLCGTGRACL